MSLESFFQLKENNTSVRQELLAGLTTFMAMSYLIFVVPSMLADAGIPKDAAIASTIFVTIADQDKPQALPLGHPPSS